MLKKAVHHLANTRPQWYKDYHEWRYHGILHWATFVVSCVIILMAFMNVLGEFASEQNVNKASATAQTHVRQDITGGALTIAQTGDEYMSTVSASINHQDSTGDLGTVTVTDARGTGVGWSATATSTNFYKYNTPVTTSGVNSITLGNSTPYATSSAGTYTITITTGGTPGNALFSVAGLETLSDQPTTGGTDVSVGTRGLKANFSGTYSIGDQWTIRVDTIDLTRFRLTPGSLTTISGSNTNVTPGSLNFFDSISENVNLITATAGYGLGSYSIAPTLGLGIPANSYTNTYTARVTLTAS